MKALDLFAGTGWGVACQRLGIQEDGVDNMDAVCRTREHNGMATIFYDAWTGLIGNRAPSDYDLQIASPPCQTFSMATTGSGRKALDDVLAAMEARLYRAPQRLFELTKTTDARTALVLVPLAYAYLYRPKFIIWEQVPTVFPVWQAAGRLLEKGGYSVWTGKMQAEQYGVPQTRQRAILIARADGAEAAPPKPTHSKFYPRDPKRLDPGVLSWISLAKALRWEGSMGKLVGTQSHGIDTKSSLPGRDRPIISGAASGPEVWYERPATTVAGSDVIAGPGWSDPTKGGVSRQNRPGSIRVTPREAATLQSYPETFEFMGNMTEVRQQIGNAVPPLLAEAILKEFL